MSDFNVKERIEMLTDDMIRDLEKLVKYNSVQSDPLPGMPFGEGPAMVLKEALKIADGMGFETVNLDNYCGYAQIGQGKEIIGMVAHLDIVPAGDGWHTDPFVLTRKKDTLYGRGVSDDKGAAIASLYTLKLLRESGIPLDKRIRVIFGCNEETGSKCMKHYNEVEEPLTAGFTPDGEFPGIHGEKGFLRMTAFSKDTKIISMNGGFVGNAVCHKCTTQVSENDVDVNCLKEALSKTDLISYNIEHRDGKITIEAQGKSAHASTPLLGINAAACTMKALEDAGMQDSFVRYYNSHIGLSCDGAGYGIRIGDEYGDLTLNNGIVKTQDGKISASIDIRYPVTYSAEKMKELVSGHLEDEDGVTIVNDVEDPLFYPADSPLVKSLYDAYVEVTKDTEHKPMVIGGGTYAKYIPGIIAFGCEFTGSDNHIHDADEKLEIAELKAQVEIYEYAVRKLMEAY